MRRLDCLERSEAVALLNGLLVAHAPEAANLERLAVACADHPLSLTVAGSYLTSAWEQWTVADYAARIEERREMLRLDGIDGHDAMASLDLSVTLLEEREPDLAGQWRDLAVMPGDFDGAAAAAVWEMGAAPGALPDLAGMAEAGEAFDIGALLAALGGGDADVETAPEATLERLRRLGDLGLLEVTAGTGACTTWWVTSRASARPRTGSMGRAYAWPGTTARCWRGPMTGSLRPSPPGWGSTARNRRASWATWPGPRPPGGAAGTTRRGL